MPRFNEVTLLAFDDELEKQALDLAGLGQTARRVGGYLARQGTTAGAGTALGAVGGAALGTGIGGVRGYREAKRQGATTGQALLHGTGRGLKGALTGGAVGAAAGGVAGLAGGGRARELAAGLRERKGALGAISRFGEKEVHGVTGALPQTAKGGKALSKTEAVRSLDLGAAPALKRVAKAEKALAGGDWHGKGTGAVKGLQKELRSAKDHQAAAERIEELGATSLPGYLKALATRPMDTISAGARQQWHGAGTGAGGAVSRGLSIGFPAMGVIGAMKGPAENEQGTRGQRVGRALGGSMAYGLASMPMAGLTLLGGMGAKAGDVLGRGIDPRDQVKTSAAKKKKLTLGLVPPPGPEPEEADVYSPSVEHEYSDSALGQPPTEGEVQ